MTGHTRRTGPGPGQGDPSFERGFHDATCLQLTRGDLGLHALSAHDGMAPHLGNEARRGCTGRAPVVGNLDERILAGDELLEARRLGARQP